MRSVCLSVCVGGSEVNSLAIVVLYPGAVQPPDSLREENTEKLRWLNGQLSMWNLILRFMNMRHGIFLRILAASNTTGKCMNIINLIIRHFL